MAITIIKPFIFTYKQDTNVVNRLNKGFNTLIFHKEYDTTKKKRIY